MTVSLARPPRHWLVVFHDEPTRMRIIAIHPAPTDPNSYAELRTELDAACLSAYDVDASTAGEARRAARQLRDVARIQDVFARARTRSHHRRRQAAHGCTTTAARQVLARAGQALALTPAAADRAERILLTALGAAWRYRPVHQRHLLFEQYIQALNPGAVAAMYEHAAFVATGRKDEAVAALIHALNRAHHRTS